MNSETDVPEISTAQKLNLETAQIAWQELQRFFARGVVIVVDPELDLVATAVQCVENAATSIESLIESGQLRGAEMEDARRWHEQSANLWAVVVAPWVLVQESADHSTC